MDDRLVRALAYANHQATMVQQRENLKLRYLNGLLHANNGGIFSVSPVLLALVDLLLRQGLSTSVLIDDNDLPIRIDLAEFLETIVTVYTVASNEYLAAWEELRQASTPEAAISA